MAQEVATRLEALQDPNQTDYDEALDEWLPAISRQFQEIRVTHENDQQHYRKLADEAVERIQRAWERLDRLEPREVPGPTQSIDELEAEMNAYLTDARKRGDDPKLLQQVVGRRAQALEQRIEDTLGEIVQGRKTLDSLTRQYRKRIQGLRALRSRVSTLAQGNQWPQLPWDIEQAEQTWTQIMALERDSHTSPFLDDGQRPNAKSASTPAWRPSSCSMPWSTICLAPLIAWTTSRRRSMPPKSEHGAVSTGLRDEGDEEQARGASRRPAIRLMRYVEMAQAATTFEDALSPSARGSRCA